MYFGSREAVTSKRWCSTPVVAALVRGVRPAAQLAAGLAIEAQEVVHRRERCEVPTQLAARRGRRLNGTFSSEVGRNEIEDVLVIGAGPTGLLLAGDLARAGVRCTVLERRAVESNLTVNVCVAAQSMGSSSLRRQVSMRWTQAQGVPASLNACTQIDSHGRTYLT
jgi:hypothetical protein